jgi:hypothetical protein
MKKLFTATEEVANTTTFQEEHEITVYGTISNPEGLKQCDDIEYHVDYIAFFEKKGCKARVRVLTRGDIKVNQFTLKQKIEEELHGSIASSTEHTIEVDDSFVESFKKIAEEPLIKTRYKFNSKAVPITYTVDGESKQMIAESVIYEVDVFDGVDDICKIDIELDSIINAISSDELKDKKIAIAAKVSHLPFKPVDVFLDNGEDDTKAKIEEFWSKVKNK